MSVRRLSPNQPESFAFSPETLKQVKSWIGNYPPGKQQSAVIAILWLVQKQIHTIEAEQRQAVDATPNRKSLGLRSYAGSGWCLVPDPRGPE